MSPSHERSAVSIPEGCDSEEGVWAPRGDTGSMGFNPHRQHRRSNLDYALVAATVLICVVLVAWALFG